MRDVKGEREIQIPSLDEATKVPGLFNKHVGTGWMEARGQT
jgi:hypothetical protein